MSKRTKGCLIGGIVLYALLAAVVILVTAFRREDFHSPATASRDVFGFRDGHFGLLEPAERKTHAIWPAAKAMMKPVRIEGEKSSFLYDFSKEAKPGEVTPPSRWTEDFVDDDAVELVAFATWVPGPEDPIDDTQWMATLILRDPVSLEALDPSKRSELGLPESFTTLLPPRQYQTPLLRLVFRTRGMEYPRSTGLVAGDARTGAQVTYDLQDENDGSPRHEVSGEWLRSDTDLLLWHDTPLKCQVGFLTGTSEIAELPANSGAQIAFSERLRLQWLTTTTEGLSVNSSVSEFEPAAALPEAEKAAIRKRFSIGFPSPERVMSFALKDPPSAASKIYLRTSSNVYLGKHCGVLGDRGVSWDWEQEESDDGVAIASIADQAPDRPLRLVFVPSVTEWTGEIPGLPDMPNPRSTEDLFDCVLPRITLPEKPDDAETQLLGFIGVAAQLAWKSNEMWDEHPPVNLPEDRTFRNTTPQQLLDWYLDHTPGAYVRYDGPELVLHFNEEESTWWTRMSEGLKSNYQRILYGSMP